MNIGVFHSTLPGPGRKLGGVEVFVQRLSDQFVACGHDCTVYSLESEISPDSRFSHVPLFPHLATFFKKKLARWLLLPVALNFAPWRRHDILVLFGDDWFLVRRPNPTYRVFSGSARFESRSATSFKRKAMQGLIHYFELLAGKLCRRSGALASGTAELLGSKDLVDIGIDTSVHHPGARSKAARVLFVGTWEGRKQGNVAWKVFLDVILPAFPEAVLDFVADKEPPVPHPSVVFHRFPDDRALAALYGQAWLFLYPSTYEGYGIPYLEALACGTPVVCLHNEGADRLLTGCSAAKICRDTNELGAKAIGFLRDGPLAHAETAVNWVERYHWPVVVERYVAIFEGMQDA
jgi:phosphatidyl-myo-inositol alpha-mannosyltransferase